MRKSFGSRPRERGQLAAWYGRILEEQARSGLSVCDYADQVGMSPWTLYEWRRRLAEAEVAEPEAKVKFVEVTVAGPTRTSGPDFVVRICDGRRSIAVPTGFEVDDLRRLVTALESC